MADLQLSSAQHCGLTYRADLRELNEFTTARFEAKLEQRLAELRTEIAGLRTELVRWMFGF